jgi:secondary thiamine-phosphate synthase enzyme
MPIHTDTIMLDTRGRVDIHDITARAQEIVSSHGLADGQILLFVPGSTGGLTTVEYEPGLLQDLPEAFERLVPEKIRYHHDDTWHDGNGHSHVRASLLGPSLVVPFAEGKLLLGTWQQIIFIDFDNRSRSRQIVAQLSGE